MDIVQPVTIVVQRAAHLGRRVFCASVTDSAGQLVYLSGTFSDPARASRDAAQWVVDRELRIADLFWERPSEEPEGWTQPTTPPPSGGFKLLRSP